MLLVFGSEAAAAHGVTRFGLSEAATELRCPRRSQQLQAAFLVTCSGGCIARVVDPGVVATLRRR